MHETLRQVAEKLHLPDWWVEMVAVEYSDCREFCTRQQIWRFDFSRVSAIDLEEIVLTKRVVCSGAYLLHNIRPEVQATRLMEKLVSLAPAEFVEEAGDIMASGPASKYSFPFRVNQIDVWDPLLSFSEHVQVLDEGRIWQWEVARVDHPEGAR